MVVAFVAGAGAARATIPISRPGVVPPGHIAIGSRAVDQNVTFSTDDACRYSTSLHGTVTTMMAPAAREDRALYLLPSLRIRSRVNCRDGAVGDTGWQTVLQPTTYGGDFERLLEVRGTVQAIHGAHLCAYAPHIRTTGSRIRFDDVRSTCGSRSIPE
jgi:hypothetical protein